jgi:3-hydroxybutyryl-CoA dehydrogenase
MVKAGWHGRKTGRGVYAYDDEGRRVPDSGIRASL